jgi:hypothetical protein
MVFLSFFRLEKRTLKRERMLAHLKEVLEDLSFTATVNGFSVFFSIGETNIEEREDLLIIFVLEELSSTKLGPYIYLTSTNFCFLRTEDI